MRHCVVIFYNKRGRHERDKDYLGLVEDPDGNVQHIATHGITIEEVEEVLLDRNSEDTTSRSSGRPITFGSTSRGRSLAVVWEHVDDDP